MSCPWRIHFGWSKFSSLHVPLGFLGALKAEQPRKTKFSSLPLLTAAIMWVGVPFCGLEKAGNASCLWGVHAEGASLCVQCFCWVTSPGKGIRWQILAAAFKRHDKGLLIISTARVAIETTQQMSCWINQRCKWCNSQIKWSGANWIDTAAFLRAYVAPSHFRPRKIFPSGADIH